MFRKFILILASINVLYCIFLLGELSAGKCLPTWSLFILMIVSVTIAVDLYIKK